MTTDRGGTSPSRSGPGRPGLLATGSGALPQRIGPYRPIAKLGEGGMGAVYRAVRDDGSGGEVALKVISESFSAKDQEASLRFEREARILKSLRHPNIVSLLDVGLDGRRAYFAMELLEGVTLDRFSGRPYPESVPLLVQVARGLEYLASRSVVHRDLSLSNVLVTVGPDGLLAKILDFGMAKSLEGETPLDSFTRTGVIIGKPAYWSPELLGCLAPGERIDWRSDVYTLGVMFYVVLTGRPPFEALTPNSLASAHLWERPLPLTAPEGRPPLPRSLNRLVFQMMEKDRSKRPQSLADVIARLEDSLEGRSDTTAEDPAAEAPTAELTLPTQELPFGTQVTRTQVLDEPTELMREPARHAPPRRTAFLATASLAAVAIAAWLYLGRAGTGPPATADPAAPVASAEVPVAAVPAPPEAPAVVSGTLVLDAVPWARIARVVDEARGVPVPSVEGRTTPAVLELPAGRYALEVVNGVGGDTRTVHVVLVAEAVHTETVVFQGARDLLPLLDAGGRPAP